ncbi:hypothetical protein A1Q1_02603 [Trichosporon asahii var. asahii CBS 2479]|uniref:Uncharacterized protein n=1 Tax=Trichosporon asahii var. asahii (strain ATCC 90039 / CBS 2479 / JCM 2466 / KCTC 7840 / NBRC 103889/ NCYC 2677 / UAMH 7654) TaxID=1186058 RepID=J4UBQ3_TRIAS|nr:hypothetical protein A1Q1_02603 [Trichosporon asahii var. asahii CBS 2479]EJT48320.1 hypothetical protein A1Q1_02603 [Trichosporon asahii var. asahii CBS 2479]
MQMESPMEMNNTGVPGAPEAEPASGLGAAGNASVSRGSSPGAPTQSSQPSSRQLDEQLDLDLKLESLTLETETTHTATSTSAASSTSYHHWQQQQSSSSSTATSSYNAYRHHQATREFLLSLQYSEHAHAVLTLDQQQRHPYQSHARSHSHAELPLNPISIQPSLPPSLTTTPDSPIARSVPLPSVEDVFTSRPCSPWQGDFPDSPSPSPRNQPPGVGHEHCCEPVYRNRLLDMVRDEFGSALELDDNSSVNSGLSGSTHGLELEGMSRTVSRSASRSVSRSNTIRSVRSAVSRASTSRGISPQPTIVLSLEGDDEEMLHEGTEDDGSAQRSFRPLTASDIGGSGEAAIDAGEGVLDASEPTTGAREAREAPSEAQETLEAQGASETCALVASTLSVAELRTLALPPSWPRVSLLSPEKLVIDRRVHSASSAPATVIPDPDFGGMVPLDIPEFQLGDAAIDVSAGGSSLGSQLGSSVGSSTSACSRISRDRKGSIETAITCSSLASCAAPACAGTGVGQGAAQGVLFGRDFAARLMLELYRASMLKSPIASPLSSPTQSPSTGTATAWWGGGLSVRAAAREVLRDDEPSEPLPQGSSSGSLGLGFDANAQEVVLPDSDSGSNCSTPIAATAPRNRPVVTTSGFRLEGKVFEFDPPFAPSEAELLCRELLELISREGVEVAGYHPHYPPNYGSPEINGHIPYAPCGLSARLADPRAASLGPLAPELATTRPSTPPDTPTVGCAPLPTLTAPVTPIQTRPSSPTVLQKAVAINAALQQLARNSGSPLAGINVTNERPSRLEEMRRQSLRAAGIASPSSSGGSPAPSGARRKSLEWAKMTPRSSGEYARDIFGGLLRESAPNASVSQPSSPEFLKRKLAGSTGEWDLSTTESAPGSPKSSRRNTLSGLGLFLSRARTKQK